MKVGNGWRLGKDIGIGVSRKSAIMRSGSISGAGCTMSNTIVLYFDGNGVFSVLLVDLRYDLFRRSNC